MIHHISIAAQNPQHVAQVLAEIFKGQAVPFPPHPGSYMALAMDEHSTFIEIYPLGSQIIPGSGLDGCSFVQHSQTTQLSAIHAAVSVPTSQTEIEQIGKREGWRVVRCDRNSLFDVIEFWVENTLMLELLTPDMTVKYLTMTQDPVVLKQFLGESVEAISVLH
jgi:hypothetical protein